MASFFTIDPDQLILPVDLAANSNAVRRGNLGVAAGEGNGAEDIEAAFRRDFNRARLLDFAQNGDPLHRVFHYREGDMRVDDVILVELLADLGRRLVHRLAGQVQRAEQREGDRAALGDAAFGQQIVFAENGDSNEVVIMQNGIAAGWLGPGAAETGDSGAGSAARTSPKSRAAPNRAFRALN